jgi:transcriptional regulator with XRE-family HTH domain
VAEEGLRVLAENVRTLRAERGWSLRRVTERSGVAFSAVHRLEQGQGSLEYRSVVLLAHCFGVPVTDLVEPAWRRRLRTMGRDDGQTRIRGGA